MVFPTMLLKVLFHSGWIELRYCCSCWLTKWNQRSYVGRLLWKKVYVARCYILFVYVEVKNWHKQRWLKWSWDMWVMSYGARLHSTVIGWYSCSMVLLPVKRSIMFASLIELNWSHTHSSTIRSTRHNRGSWPIVKPPGGSELLVSHHSSLYPFSLSVGASAHHYTFV